jgi:hypothetical protein
VSAQAISLGAFAISVVSLIVSTAGLRFAGTQSRHAAYATSMATARHFITDSRALWQQCEAAASAGPEGTRRFEVSVGDIMAHFELVATFLADGMAEGRTYRLVSGTVRDYLDHMSQRGFSSYVQKTLDTDEVCENLKEFCIQHSPEFRHAEAVFDMLKIPRSSL